MAKTDHHPSSKKTGRLLCKHIRLPYILVGIILLLASYLIFATKPWDPGLDFSPSAKSSVRTHSYVMDGLWWGSLINLVMVSLSLYLSRFYPRSNPDNPSQVSPELEIGSTTWQSLPLFQRRVILSLSMLAVALSAWLNAPILNHSLWGDEEATARRFIVGYVSRQDDSTLKLHRPTWERTLWHYDDGPNNHILFSVLGKLSHNFARPGSGPDDFYFSEFWIRLPAYISGLGAVAAMTWLMISMGFPRTAPLASTILALHPWFVRWGTEARGYALELLFIPLILVFLLKALRSKPHLRCWWWSAYGFTEFLLLYSHLGAVYFLLPLNIAAFALVWKQSTQQGYSSNPIRQPGIWQLTGANLLGAFFTIQLMAPCLKPLGIWLGKSRVHGDISPDWISDWFSYFASGMPWNSWDKSNPYCLPLPQFLADHPIPAYSLLLFIFLSLIAGIVVFLGNRTRLCLLLPLLAPGLLTVMHAKIGGNLLYPWYMVGFLPLSIVILSIGLDRISRLLPTRSSLVVISILFLTAFFVTTHAQRQLFRNHPVEALAESVRLTRSTINPFHSDIDKVITLDIVHATKSYDPAHLKIRSIEALVDALKQADDTGRPLYINLGNPGLLGRDLPGIEKLIWNEEVFTAPTLIHGLQNPCTRYIFQYRPHSIKNIPLPIISKKNP